MFESLLWLLIAFPKATIIIILFLLLFGWMAQDMTVNIIVIVIASIFTLFSLAVCLFVKTPQKPKNPEEEKDMNGAANGTPHVQKEEKRNDSR